MRSISIISVLMCSLVVSVEARAVTVSRSALPQTIQSTFCPSSSSCSVFLNSVYSDGKVSAFSYGSTAYGSTAADQGLLLRYDLTPPSGQTDINGNQTAAYDGYLWMRVQNSYSTATATHAVTLYLDKVTPATTPLFGQNSYFYPEYADANGDLSLFLTTADLLAGRAYRTWLDSGIQPGGIDAGNLQGELPLPCLAAGCKVHAEINLVQLQYQLVGTSVQVDINPDDIRGLVYRQSQGYLNPDDSSLAYNTVQTFAISAVPEPSVVALLACGLGMVVFAARRRRT